ncbi:MAG: oligopeptide transporter, OPT family [Candidatus Eisenbacteria bacterium]
MQSGSDVRKGGETPFEPHVPASASLPEFTAKSIVAGIFFGILFGAANAYLGLRAGLTISTSIPVAVMTVAVFRALALAGVRGSILEANLSQTVGSASSSVASGVVFTLPALFLWGLDPGLLQMTLLALFGGFLGTLFMIPLRSLLIQREHGRLPYPEGTACAEVLLATEGGGARAGNVFLGLFAGAFFRFLGGWLRLFPEKIEAGVPLLPKGRIGLSLSPALFGVGYILGPRVAAIMVGGGLLSSVVLIPLIAVWGAGRAEPLYPETVKTIASMSSGEIWERYVRYIGAGAVAAAGFLTLVRSLPVMIESFRLGTSGMRKGLGRGEETPRTSRDFSLAFVLGGSLLLVAAMGIVPQAFAALPSAPPRFLAAVLVVLFSFFFVTVASRIVGLVGVTSNPTSGMTIASLLGTSAVFLALGWTGMEAKAAALTVGCVIAIAASISGDMSQDLKTGFLLGATPKRQQAGELLGVLTSAMFVCLAVLMLDRAHGFGTSELPAPQATLMKLVIEGVLDRSLPWALVGIGVGIALLAAALRLPTLPFAVGVYLPISTMVPVFLGGALRLILEAGAAGDGEKRERAGKGILFGSGLVGGEGLLGVGIAAAVFARGERLSGIGSAWAGAAAPFVGLGAFLLLAAFFRRRCVGGGSREGS